MEYTTLGQTGLRVFYLYSDSSNEEIVGRALKTYVRCDDVVVATKVFF
ncbi:hypothetical protein [Sodalis-like endosymbiont of Proechinophthirus fluctus]